MMIIEEKVRFMAFKISLAIEPSPLFPSAENLIQNIWKSVSRWLQKVALQTYCQLVG